MACEATFIALPLFVAESDDESDDNDDSEFDEFILSKENLSTPDEDTSLDANTSILGKLI